jgi:hypothetical protein
VQGKDEEDLEGKKKEEKIVSELGTKRGEGRR